MRRSLVLSGILGLGLMGVWAHAAQQPAALSGADVQSRQLHRNGHAARDD